MHRLLPFSSYRRVGGRKDYEDAAASFGVTNAPLGSYYAFFFFGKLRFYKNRSEKETEKEMLRGKANKKPRKGQNKRPTKPAPNASRLDQIQNWDM